jgi:hypothetical protein
MVTNAVPFVELARLESTLICWIVDAVTELGGKYCTE